MMSCGFSSCTEHVSACLCSAGLNSGRSTMRSTLITRASRPWVICTLFPPVVFPWVFCRCLISSCFGGLGEQGSRGKVACYVRGSE
jgi:hypothetical protein